ncbi:MAG: MurR/RpiR family transcriptional regulator [Erysipelotrichaceae bacterium]
MKLTKIEQDILKQVLVSMEANQKLTVDELAQQCFVSKSMIVKLSKKLGYRGYTEMQYKLKPKTTVEVNNLALQDPSNQMTQYVQALADLFYYYKDAKNIVISSKNNMCVNQYITRKLCYFDVFATGTYDFDMIKTPRKDKGIALFLVEESDRQYMMDVIRNAKEKGFNIIVFSNDFAFDSLLVHFNVIFRKHKAYDFFRSDILVLFEYVLAAYAKALYEERTYA